MTAPDVVKLREALVGRYDIQRELGGGGMSRVFVATEMALGRDVVIKVMSAEVMGDAGAERFAREVKLAARLQHSNIVPVLTAGDANGMAYYTMPMVRGETVRERLQRGAVPSAESRAIYRPEFLATLWQYPGTGGWMFAPVPDEHAPPVTHAWGRTPVRATVDGQTWKTSVWRGKDGRTLLAIPKKVRGTKAAGDQVRVCIEFNSL